MAADTPARVLADAVEAAARGAVLGGGSRHCVAAAVAAAARTVLAWQREVGSVEVEARLDMVRPALSRLVNGDAVPGGQRAVRNFGLHADLGCGAGALPRTTCEAKRRGRGGLQRAQNIEAAPGKNAPGINLVNQPLPPVEIHCEVDSNDLAHSFTDDVSAGDKTDDSGTNTKTMSNTSVLASLPPTANSSRALLHR